jgi:hypothetical protein
MNLFPRRQNSSFPALTSAPRRMLLVFGFTALSSTALLFSQPAPTPDDPTNPRRRRNQEEGGAGRANLTPQDVQARMMTALRERFEVTDDEEWKLISERLTAVMELRRNATGGGFGGFGGFAGRGGPGGPGGNSDNPNRAARGPRGGGGSTELTALSTAVRDKMPDAEIKARLERVREARKDNETKLAKAQEELRALLSVRQEAAAVVAGFLP